MKNVCEAKRPFSLFRMTGNSCPISYFISIYFLFTSCELSRLKGLVNRSEKF